MELMQNMPRSLRDPLKNVWRRVVPEELRRELYAKRRERNEVLLSVIVPVYKVEQYLDECVHSIVNQSYKNLEIILVDDGSPDSCGQMCDAWATKDSRIRVLHQTNGGLSNARNNGFKLATGKYVAFADSDDLLSRNAYRMLVGSLEQSGSEVATGNVERFKGSKYWHGWNQSYSHKRENYTAAEIVDGVARGVKFEDHPELIFDATAWNKVYRSDFFRRERITFPEGKLYEDMLPVATVYSRAHAIDVVLESCYFYRMRDDNSSITQQRSQYKNLADKMLMVDRIFEMLRRADNPKPALEMAVWKTFEGDLPVYAPFIGNLAEFDAVYSDVLTRYWPMASANVIERLALGRRVLYAWQLKGQWEFALEAEAWVNENFFNIPVVMGQAGPEIDPSFNTHYLSVLDSPAMRSMRRYATGKQTITESYVEDGRLVLEGYAFIDYLPDVNAQTLSLWLEAVDGLASPVPLEVHKCSSEWANVTWGSGLFDHSNCGFLVDMDLSDKLPQLPDMLSARTWLLKGKIAGGGLQIELEFPKAWRGGHQRVGDTIRVATTDVAFIERGPWKNPFALTQKSAQVWLAAVQEPEPDLLRLTLVGSDRLQSAELVRSRDGQVITAQSRLGDTWEFDLATVGGRTDAAGSLNDWYVRCRGRIVEEDVRAIAAPGLVGSCLPGSSRWELRGGVDGSARLIDNVANLTVDSIEADGLDFVLRGRSGLAGDDGLTLQMWSDTGNSEFVDIDVDQSGDFSIRIRPYRRDFSGDTVAWGPGEYHFWLKQHGATSFARIRASVALASSGLQANIWNALCHGRFHITSENFEITLGVNSPIDQADRGRFGRQSLERKWARVPDEQVEPLRAVLFISFMGSSASDSGLAIMRELQRRGLNYEYYWGVTDNSISVPTGAHRLVRFTPEWFEVLNRAVLVVNNVGGIGGFPNRSFQRYLQTWHGTPLKHVGHSHNIEDPYGAARSELRARNEALEWDWLLSPNPFFTSLSLPEFHYDGTVLEMGYPRNDSLFNVTDEDTSRVRRRLGIPADSRVVLYAPTYRDSGASGNSSALVELLDLDSFSKSLGRDWTVLVRGHNFNVRASRKNQSRGRVLDVSTYGDINDLINISDALVTDYSSVMFDYLNTRKPIFYYVPDLESYCSSRGMYFQLEDVAVGPLLEEQDRLVENLLDLDHYWREFGARYDELAAKFVPWDDGAAANRVVDVIVGDLESSK